jgi:pSer/pThr/pTyr-binding forkhead associated (FHA) protein
MTLEVGIACGVCDTFSAMGTPSCPRCGNVLEVAVSEPRPMPPSSLEMQPSAASWEAAVAAVVKPHVPRPLTEEELMEQARNYVCKQCSTPVPSGHKFCGRCGAPVPAEIVELQVRFFGAMQAPGKARLVLIRGGDGTEGLTYLLQGQEHIAGRGEGAILFPDDLWLSSRHANFFYQGERLFVRDESRGNGVYVRIRQPVPIVPGDQFLCGEQVFRLDPTPKDTSGPDPDMTYFYSSPKRPSPFRITQVLRGGHAGLVACARENALSIGREECDVNFPEDLYMSGQHARVEHTPQGTYLLTDTGSRNGTYLRIRGERELANGDYLFLGRQLLRVEITA